MSAFLPGSAGRVACVPPIVPIVLHHSTRLHRRGVLDDDSYRARLERLTREELAPRGLNLRCVPMRTGGCRFEIHTKPQGAVVEKIFCRPGRRTGSVRPSAGRTARVVPERGLRLATATF